MHSPEVLAFSIRSPFPSMKTKIKEDKFPKWQFVIRRRDDGSFFYSPFIRAFGYEWYFDSWIDVWHYEPGGRDALTVCRDRIYDKRSGKFKKYTKTWKLHFWHYHISWSLLHKWRRRLLTRCAECGGPSRKGNMVNHSDSGWGGRPKTPFYAGEIHLYHSSCLDKKSARIHKHDPRGCYQCSGKGAFEWERRQRSSSAQLAKRLFKPKT